MSGNEPTRPDPECEPDDIDVEEEVVVSEDVVPPGRKRGSGRRPRRGPDMLGEIERSIDAYDSRIYLTRIASVLIAVLAFALGILLNPLFLLLIVAAAVMFWILETSLKPVAWPFVLSRAHSEEKIRLTEVTEYSPSVEHQIKQLHLHLTSDQPEDLAKIDSMLVAKHKNPLYLSELLLGLLSFLAIWFLYRPPKTTGTDTVASGFYTAGMGGPSTLQVKLVLAGGEPLTVPIALKIDAPAASEPLSVPISVKAGVVEAIRLPLEVTSTKPEPVQVRFQTKVDEVVAVKLPIQIKAEASADVTKPLRVPVQITAEASTTAVKPIKVPVEVDLRTINQTILAPPPVEMSPPPYMGRHHHFR